MSWKDYEKEIYDNLKQLHSDSTILFNQNLIGRYSKTSRQIDILIEGYIAGKKIRQIIDAKCFNKKVDVKDVESFISMVEDVDAQQGVIITTKGYTPAAINRAHYGPTDIELDIQNFDNFKDFQSLVVILYAGDHAAIIFSPFGWIIDGNQTDGVLATYYQRGLTLETARQNNEWGYVSIFEKTKFIRNLDDLVQYQENYTKQNHPTAVFKYDRAIQRKDKSKTLLRTITIDTYSTNEYTGFIEFKDFFLLFVMFTPIELSSKNLRKLESLIQNAISGKNDKTSLLLANLQRLELGLENASDFIEKAEILIAQGDVHTY